MLDGVVCEIMLRIQRNYVVLSAPPIVWMRFIWQFVLVRQKSEKWVSSELS